MTRLESEGMVALARGADDPKGVMLAMQWSRFHSHVPCSENKYKMDRYVKVSGQAIYAGSLQRFSRAVVIRSIKDLLRPGVILMVQAARAEGISLSEGSWSSKLFFQTHSGYGATKLITKKGRKVISKGSSTSPTFDLDNQWIWRKCFQDVCVSEGLIDKDTVERIRTVQEEWVEVDDYSERSLIFAFKPITGKRRPIKL